MKVLVILILVFSQIGFDGLIPKTKEVRHGNRFKLSENLAPYVLLLAPTIHDYHLSNIEIEFNEDAQALQIIMKIFIDDLEDGIAASGVEEKLYLRTEREIEAGDQHVFDYLTKKMIIHVDGAEVHFNYIGKETSEDLIAMYCYLEVENISSVTEITVSNDMLMELFDDQINIVKLKSTATGKRGFMMLKKGQHSDTAEL